MESRSNNSSVCVLNAAFQAAYYDTASEPEAGISAVVSVYAIEPMHNRLMLHADAQYTP
jgi:hypothetical protein